MNNRPVDREKLNDEKQMSLMYQNQNACKSYLTTISFSNII